MENRLEEIPLLKAENSFFSITLPTFDETHVLKTKEHTYKLEDYIKSYNQSLKVFIEYAIDLTSNNDWKNQKNRPAVLEYYVNEMELKLLLAVQASVSINPTWIQEMEGCSFILSETFFIKLCKNIFGIPPAGDFTSKFSDHIFPTVEMLLKKLDNASYKVLCLNESFNITFFHKKSKTVISELLHKATDITEGLKMYFLASNEIDTLRKLIEPFVGTKEKFKENFTRLEESLEYRVKKRSYFQDLIQYELNTGLDDLQKAADNSVKKLEEHLDIIMEGIDELCQSNFLSSEERKFLTSEKDYLKTKQLMMLPSSSLANLMLAYEKDDSSEEKVLTSCEPFLQIAFKPK